MDSQPVIWIVQFNDGSQIKEFDENGKETVFNSSILERKDEFSYIALYDKINGISYSVDLEGGYFILRGQNFNIAKEIDGRIHNVSGNSELDFKNGVIQFKCSKPLIINTKTPLPTTAEPKTFNIGYKVDLGDNFCNFKKSGNNVSVIKCQALLSVDRDTLQPSISTTFTYKVTMPDGKEYFYKS